MVTLQNSSLDDFPKHSKILRPPHLEQPYVMQGRRHPSTQQAQPSCQSITQVAAGQRLAQVAVTLYHLKCNGPSYQQPI